MKSLPFFFSVCLLSFSGFGSAHLITSTQPTLPNEHVINTGYPIGNGRLGAMIGGEVKESTFTFNVDSLWTGDANISGSTNDAENDANYQTMGKYQVFGVMKVKLTVEGNRDADTLVRDYKRELDIEKAIYSDEFTLGEAHIKRVAFASAPDDAIFYIVRSDKPITCSVTLCDKHSKQEGTSFSGKLPNNLAYAANVSVQSSPTEVVIVLRAATSFDRAAADFGLNGKVPTLANTVPDYRTAAKKHVADYQKYYNRCSLELRGADTPVRDNSIYELLFNYGRYLLISCSRPGTLPANLQGLWNESNNPPWHCDYHTNINIQMNYWAVENTNLSDCWEPMTRWLRMCEKNATENTRKAFPGSKGFAYRTSMNFCGGQGWAWNYAGAPWMAAQSFEHYLFTQDKEYLAKDCYPHMKGAMEFMFGHLVETKDGLMVKNGWSPEHGPREDGVAHDQQILRELLKCLIKAQQVLKDPKERAFIAKCKDTYKRLAPDKIGSWGQLQEWQVDRDVKGDSHRHTSHLFAVYPGTTINRDTPELFAAAKVALGGRSNTADSWRSWTWPWRAALWARMGEAEKAGEMIRSLPEHNMLPNYFANHPPMQMDGNFGFTAAVAEMLIQSHETDAKGKVIIRLLPACPKMWANGEAKGLKARGGYTVDMKWQDGKVIDYKITGGKRDGYTLSL